MTFKGMKLFWLITGGTAEVIRAENARQAVILAGRTDIDAALKEIEEIIVDGPHGIIFNYS